MNPRSATTRHRRPPSPPELAALGVCGVIASLVLAAPSAVAQEEPSGATDDDSTPRAEPPELEQFVEAEYPERAAQQGIEGTVVLILTIDAEGQVEAVEVVRGPGHGLDEAAREAARDFEFRPARRGDTPVASRIRYKYEFEAPESGEAKRDSAGSGETPERVSGSDSSDSESDAAMDAPAEPGRLAGRVRRPNGDGPARGARVVLEGPDGETHQLRTDEEGRFRTEPLPAGRYDVSVVAPEGARTSLQTELLPGETTEVELQLRAASESDEAIRVTVEGESRAEQLERSARAVDVIELEEAKQSADDMGEVVSSEKGVGVRRTGGLGSGSRLSLNGLNDNQVRIFLDGIPLEWAGYPFGLANVPVHLVDRVDIYKGVVPVRYGADALGGAIDLVRDDAPQESTLSASYQVGSYDTHRATLGGTTPVGDEGLYVRANAFFDSSQNDYPVDVEIADRTGQISEVTARRFHDMYRAGGGGFEVGVADRPWADRLSARLFVSDFVRDLQHNLIMTVPYGKAQYGETAGGGVLRYDQSFASDVELHFTGGYNANRTWFLDLAECNYDWFGRCTSEREQPGEIGAYPTDAVIWEHAGFGRLDGSWGFADGQTLRLAVAPTYVTRSGENRAESIRTERDPLEADRTLFDLVTGLEYETTHAGGRLENIGFFKDYVQIATTDETLPTGRQTTADRTTHAVGAGDSLRYDWTEAFRTKLSYEWATRLPSAREMFGNGVRIQPNAELDPERSHNANLEFDLHELESSIGTWRGNLTGFVRRTNNLVVLIGGTDSFTYQNVLEARSLGVEAAAGWTSPGGRVELDVDGTYTDLRNISDRGAFEDFEGDRIPNRPYLHVDGRTRVAESDVFVDGDTVSATWESRYVHEYFRGWESLGAAEYKQQIPTQWRQSVALTYAVESTTGTLSTTLEIQNLTDADVFDFYGVQRPGRTFYLQSTLTL